MLFDYFPLANANTDGLFKPKRLLGLLDTSLMQMPVTELIVLSVMATNLISEFREVILISFIYIY